MKILFAIQGTGNGHLSRARDVYPELLKYGQVDVLVSGIQADVQLPYPIKYNMYGLSFIFGKQGGVDLLDTAKKVKLFRLIHDIRQIPVQDYDLVINDFEPITAWACRLKGLPCISLSHQIAVLHPNAPKPDKEDWMGITVLKRYAPTTGGYGFHFKSYASHIYTPIIRKEIRQINPIVSPHYTVYLPAYSDEHIVQHLGKFEGVRWEVFSKHNRKAFSQGGVNIQPINNEAFIKSMAESTGVLCGGGFEGPAEAMYLGKKVMVVPMQAQYEQQCNAAGAATMGASVVKRLDDEAHALIDNWLSHGQFCNVDYPDQTSEIVARLMAEHAGKR